MKPITVLLAEDHTIVREGLRKMLELETGLVIVGEAKDGCRVVACFSATDNLIKGGAGQAIQNMNLMLGLAETASLEDSGPWP